jgi:hypothetical protein
MALSREWHPTGNYSAGGKKRILVLHTTEGFTGTNGMRDCAAYFQGDVGASSHVIIDNYHPGVICEGVRRADAAWTVCGYNSAAISAEQCGYAAWTREVWLNDKEPLLRNAAAWLAEESAATGIPLTELNDSQSQGSGSGVTYHSRLGSYGCGHSDPGPGYPLDIVLGWARGGTVPVPPQPPSGTAPPFPYPASDYLGQPSPDPHCHSGYYGGPDQANVRTWQQKMAARGWAISADGMYGPQSDRVCRQFQAEKNLTADGLVGPQTWAATWNAPVT